MDHFERFICILKFPLFSNDLNPSKQKKIKIDPEINRFDDTKQILDDILSSSDASKFKRDWIARRVDLIICPIEQFPFAMLGYF